MCLLSTWGFLARVWISKGRKYSFFCTSQRPQLKEIVYFKRHTSLVSEISSDLQMEKRAWDTKEFQIHPKSYITNWCPRSNTTNRFSESRPLCDSRTPEHLPTLTSTWNRKGERGKYKNILNNQPRFLVLLGFHVFLWSIESSGLRFSAL